jgi:hypothetical protein
VWPTRILLLRLLLQDHAEPESMADMRTLLSISTFLVATFCLMESLLGVFVTYMAYEHGPFRGVAFRYWAAVDTSFIVTTVVLFWACFKILPKKLG